MEHVIETSDGIIRYTLARKKMKNIRIRVTGEGLVVVSAPVHVAQGRIDRFVSMNTKAIERQQQRIEAQRRRCYPARYQDGDAFRFAGEMMTLCIKSGERASAVLNEGVLTLCVPKGKSAKQLFEKWMIRAARDVFTKHFLMLCGKFAAADVRLSVRSMLTRWGSINTKRRTISLTVHLARCEPELIDYVITHELCHIAHARHTAAFYRELERHYPNRRHYDKLLAQYGLVGF